MGAIIKTYEWDTGGIAYVEVRIYIDVLWFRTFLTELLVCLFVNLWTKQNRSTLRLLLLTAAQVSVQVLLFVLAGYGAVYAGGSLLLFLLLFAA